MEQIVVKTEMQQNEEILLFYVDDEEGANEHGVVTTIENLDQSQLSQIQHEGEYLMGQEQPSIEFEEEMQEEHAWSKEKWTDDETKRLLVFYTDNKASFLSGATRKKHLWTVACKTMLSSKNYASCEIKLRNLKRKYIQLRLEQDKGFNVIWQNYQLCHQAFHDDKFVVSALEAEKAKAQPKPVVSLPTKQEDAGIVVVKKVNPKPAGDGDVEAMLNLYMKHKNISNHKAKQKSLWQNIALQLGVEDGDYWHKRFLNFRNNYIRLVEKRNSEGSEGISWPYMKLFDQIYEGDAEFQRKYGPKKVLVENRVAVELPISTVSLDYLWNDTELTVLVKYYFDCYQEFQDKTIPNSFLWNEVGRLIDKSPDSCKAKYAERRAAHLDKYIEGGYELRARTPLAILYDNIICKDIQLEISNKGIKAENDTWKMEELDELVQFFYDNVEVFKDSVCYFVCWAAIAKKLRRSVGACRKHWKELTSLYKSILEDKKDNPDMQIDWRYIELFDCIFVYGMDSHLLDGYEKLQDLEKEPEKVGVKKVDIKSDDDNEFDDNISEDEESYDERGFMKRSKRRPGDSKSFKILEFYQKNKDKFNSPNRKKLALWEILAGDIGISATQCAHRFRNLKQVYTKYVQREISKPEKPILWPYYAHCKKVFGYRAIKSKLRNGKKETDDEEDWSAKEIKQLINYFAQNFDEINSNLEDKSKWSALAAEIGKVEDSCSDKLLELRKSYRKLNTMKTRNPDVKISWKYFNMFDEIYNAKEETTETVETLNEVELNGDEYEEINLADVKMEGQDDDFQCIIVIPEGQDIGDMSNAQIMINENGEMQPYIEIQTEKPVNKWTKKTKKTLLIHYINYLRMNRGKEINPTEMWKEIAAKLGDKSSLSCRKMFAKLKSNHLELANENDPNKKKTPYYTLLEKIVTMKPKFAKTGQNKTAKEDKIYKDVSLPDEKVKHALQYYLEHLEEFVSPKFENKYLWTELANHISEPLNKIISKINFLKQNFDVESGKISGDDTVFTDILREIVVKESALANDIQNEIKSVTVETIEGESWTDEETEQLLSWYLANLEKFKNPKFVRSYLWMEASDILKKSPLVCSKKMTEIRTQYKTLIKESPDELNNWRFYDLCQKIYGTGKRNTESVMIESAQNNESDMMIENTQSTENVMMIETTLNV